MNSGIQRASEDPIQRAKDLLGISDDLSIMDLCEQLTELRNTNHPDKFQDPQNKKDAEERFKEIGQILVELEKRLEQERLHTPGSQLAVIQPKLENLELKMRLVRMTDEVRQKQTEISLANYRVESLTKELTQERDKNQKESIREIMNLYRPSPGLIWKTSLGLLLTAGVGAISKIEEIGKIFQRYSPLKQAQFNTILSIFFALFLAGALHQYLKGLAFREVARLVCSTAFVQGFIRWLHEKRKSQDTVSKFSEGEVLEYVQSALSSRQSLKWKSRLLWLDLLSDQSTDALKDAFLYSLMNKNLIESSSAQGLDRHFLVKGSQRSWGMVDLPF